MTTPGAHGAWTRGGYFARVLANGARALAAAVLRICSRTERGYARSVYRVARYTSVPGPRLLKVPEGWSARSPLVGVRRLGLRLDLDLRDNLQRVLYYTGTYEPALIRFLRGELRGGDVFVDVGAHIGVHALTAARRFRALGSGRVIAFEPARDSAEKIRAATVRNGLTVTVVEAGLGDARGRWSCSRIPSTAPRIQACALGTGRGLACSRSW